jgi:tRNA (guanosine-2'-O-)-methyltransferase
VRPPSSGGDQRPPRQRQPEDIRRQRRDRPHRCWDHLVVAPLFVAYEVNLGTLLRTCDATGACLAVPHTPSARAALRKGNTLRSRSCVHWVGKPENWLRRQRDRGARIVGVELADDATRLADVEVARQKTIIVLGHEHDGIPDDVWDLLDDVIEIPMIGSGSSLNVAVAGSLVLYKLAGLA